MYNPNYEFFAPTGWVCPKCGRVYSPNTFMCFYCDNNKTKTITATGTFPFSSDWLNNTTTPIKDFQEWLNHTALNIFDYPDWNKPPTNDVDTFRIHLENGIKYD